jgi:hypothetical protein
MHRCNNALHAPRQVLRVLRLFGRMKSLNRILTALAYALVPVSSAFLILLLVCSICEPDLSLSLSLSLTLPQSPSRLLSPRYSLPPSLSLVPPYFIFISLCSLQLNSLSLSPCHSLSLPIILSLSLSLYLSTWPRPYPSEVQRRHST